MSNEIQHSKSQARLAIRYSVLAGVLLAIALVIYGIVRYPSAVALSPVESIIYLALCVGLLSGYSWLVLRRTQVATSTDGVALRWGIWLGLALGLCWLIELWAGNLAGSTPNALVLFAYRGSILAVPLLTVIIALYTSQKTHLRRTGTWIGIWSGMISALITFAGLLFIAYSGTLQRDPQTIQQALSSGVSDITAYGVADSLAAAINHLWIGPALGVLFGMLGGLIGAGAS